MRVLYCSVGVTRPAVDRSRAGQLENRVQVAMAIAEENYVKNVQKETLDIVLFSVYVSLVDIVPVARILCAVLVNFISGHGVYQSWTKLMDLMEGMSRCFPGRLAQNPRTAKLTLPNCRLL